MRIICFICAKGSSERLPRKNLLSFAGKPLLEWTLIAARAARYFTDYYMVTEDEEISDLSSDYGFTTVWQSDESARTAGHLGAPICYNLLINATKHLYSGMDCIVNLLPTSPCRKPEDIDVAISEYIRAMMKNPGKDIEVSTACRRKDLNLLTVDDNGKLNPLVFDNLGKLWVSNGSLGISNYALALKRYPEIIAAHKQFMGGQHYPDMIYRPADITIMGHRPHGGPTSVRAAVRGKRLG
jgi:CMP-N-acetylneuraminic acid synthetase